MATKNPGGWNTMKINIPQSPTENTKFDDLSTQKNAIHASIIYNPNFSGTIKWRVLFWRADSPETSTPQDAVMTRIWNPNFEDPFLSLSLGQERITIQKITPWPTNPNFDPLPRLFCSGHSFLSDGKLLVVGGHIDNYYPFGRGSRFSYIYDPFDLVNTIEGKWKYATVEVDHEGYPQLITGGRWYPTITPLPDGKMLAMSGYLEGSTSHNDPELLINRIPSLYDSDSMLWADFPKEAEMPEEFTYNYYPEEPQIYPGVTYPAGHVIPYGDWAGLIMYSAFQPHAWTFNPDINYSGTFWNQVTFDERPVNEGCCTVMLHIHPSDTVSRILTIGGVDPLHNPLDTVSMLEINVDYAEWINLEPLSFARNHANAILLPDGTVLVLGGNKSEQYYSPVLNAEIFDPETGNWTLLPEMQFARNYHSTAVLMPDGRIWMSGGDFRFYTDPTNLIRQMNNIEIYTPGYLLEGDRPTITAHDSTLTYNTNFHFTTDIPIEKAILIRPGSTTHAFDQNQRAVFVEITRHQIIGPTEHRYTATAPLDGNVAPKGVYMLFVTLAKEASTSGLTAIPSVAQFVSIS